MNRIDTSTITALHQMPWKAPSLDFVQDNIEEGVNAIVKSYISTCISAGTNNYASPTFSWGMPLTYASNIPYLLTGGRYTYSTTGTTGTFSIEDGSVFFNDRMYSIPAQIITFSATSSSYIGVTTSFEYSNTADPTTFSDLTIENIHKNYILRFSHNTGSVTASNWLYYYKPATNTLLQNIGQDIPWQNGGTTFTMLGGTYDVSDVNYNRWKITGNTLTWQLSLRSFSITSPTTVVIYMPPAIKATYGKSWYAHLSNITGILNATSTAQVVRVECLNGGINYINVYPISGTFSIGTNNRDLDIVVTGEVF